MQQQQQQMGISKRVRPGGWETQQLLLNDFIMKLDAEGAGINLLLYGE